MKTEAKTPAEIGLSLNVISGPRGEVRAEYDQETGKPLPGWPCIAYTVELMDARRRVIWAGPYRLGVGHVKWPALAALNYGFHKETVFLSELEKDVARIKARGQTYKKTPEALEADATAAAKLAKRQRVAPTLNDVCHSLLMDGSAFFDGERFEDWAANYGYSSDSIRAKETFETCDRIGRDLSRAMSRDELAALREWAGNY